jgi:hypothetical protein
LKHSQSSRPQQPLHDQQPEKLSKIVDTAHSTLEFELRRVQHFATRQQARTAVAAWIEDYNTRRRHTACQKMAPAAYEQLLAAREEAA